MLIFTIVVIHNLELNGQVHVYYSYWFLGARVAQWVRSLDLTTHTSLSPIRRGFAPGFVIYKKGCTRLAAASDKVYQLLAHGRWFSPASSTTKTGRHDIAEILLKVALRNQKSKILILMLMKQSVYVCMFVCIILHAHLRNVNIIAELSSYWLIFIPLIITENL